MHNPQSKGWGGLPEGLTTLEAWKPFVIENPGRVFIAGDLHIPYHDKNAIVTAMAYAKKFKPDTIILNGDVSDFFSVSFWQNDPTKRDLPGELRQTQEFLGMVRAGFRKARIIYKLGNHEERWERYLRVKAPEVYKLDVLQIGELLKLSKFGIELVDQKKPMRAGDLNIIHGHEYRFSISNPVSPARGLFLRGRAYAICNHFHQISHQTGRSIEDKVIACWSIGCLCDLHPEYAPFNEWQHGIATVEVSDSGKFNLENKKISHGKLY